MDRSAYRELVAALEETARRSPDALRRLAWDPPAVLSEQAVDAFLEALDARAWQRGLVVPVLTPLLG